jgi:hypothetical protein
MNLASKNRFDLSATKSRLLVFLASSAVLGVVAQAIFVKPVSVSAAAPKLAPLVADRGKFRIMVNGQPVGKEEFEITPSGNEWSAHANSELQTPQGVMKVNGTLTLHADGTPIHYDWATQGIKKASSTIAFSGTSASVELHIEGARPFSQDFTFNTPLVSVLDNNLYHQYELLARLYDRDAKGSQTFTVLVPQEMTPGSVTVDSMGKQESGGKQLEELRVRTEDNEIDLYLDGQRLMRLVAPAANAEIIREEK